MLNVIMQSAVTPLSSASFNARLLALPTNIRLGWKGTSTLAYYKRLQICFQIYMGHEICEDMFPFSWTPFSSSHYEKLTMSLWGMGLWIFIAFILFKKKLFLSV